MLEDLDADPSGLVAALSSGPFRSFGVLEDDEAIEWAVRRTFRGRIGYGGVAARFYDVHGGWLDPNTDTRDPAEGGPGPLDHGGDRPSMELAWTSFENLELTCWEEGQLRVLRKYRIVTEGASEVIREDGRPEPLDARPSGGPS